MRQTRITKPYTTTEIDEICKLYYEENMTAKDVAELTGRTVGAVKQVVLKNRATYIKEEAPVAKPATEIVAPPLRAFKAQRP